ncbi:MAG: hypothetical protein JWQ74_3335 [Marmoricola sp.]|nr:hypothetical protein [Marmoricola sp.]
MSHIGPDGGPEDDGFPGDPETAPPPAEPRLPRAGSRRAERSAGGRVKGCLPMLLVLVVLLAGAFFGGSWALDKVRSLVGDDPDFGGNGTGKVVVQVHKGDSSTDIGQTLKDQGVVKSVGAFVKAATANDKSRGIQVGFYQLKKEMKASVALGVLVDPKNLIETTVTIPEGFRVKQIVARIVDKTDFTKKQVEAALAKPASLGLPAEADGSFEGYLFPATYTVLPGATPTSLLTQMVDKTEQVEKSLDITAKAEALGLTPHQVLTVASILEYEASRDQDYPKVAQAIYNRLDAGMMLQSDATVAFANNLTKTLYTSDKDRAIDSPYNTYKYTGLPPGPIGAAGEKTIKAALNPTPGPWLFWVVVNLKTGETRFNTTLAGHNADVEAFRQYCRTSDAC